MSLTELIKTKVYCSYALTNNRLFHPSLILVAADRYLVLIAFHHIIGDGISGPLFLKKLERAYLDIGQDHAPLPLADFTATDQTTYDTAEINAFWRQHLTNAYALNPLTPSIKTDQQQILQQTIDHTLWQKMRQFCKANKTTPAIFITYFPRVHIPVFLNYLSA